MEFLCYEYFLCIFKHLNTLYVPATESHEQKKIIDPLIVED